MTSRLARFLLEPEVRDCAVDGPQRLTAHRAVLQRKDMIRDVFVDFHRLFRELDQRFLSGEGTVIELGAGIFPVRESFPDVLATDIVASQALDRVLDAGEMALPDASVRSFYLQNVFHHFPQPRRFFAELQRTLVPGGGAILIEPHSGPIASLMYPKLFASEGFDKTSPCWESLIKGPMSGANQALSHLVFDRDLARFNEDFPGIEVVHRDVLDNYLRYLVSGGLNFRPLLPALASASLQRLERWLSPLRVFAGLHRVIVLRKYPVPA